MPGGCEVMVTLSSILGKVQLPAGRNRQFAVGKRRNAPPLPVFDDHAPHAGAGGARSRAKATGKRVRTTCGPTEDDKDNEQT
jgi:hypothetical protein